MKTEDLQKKILDIFIEIDKLCEKHNLRYYAIGGTCLGAVRHQGFIPWDDDLDIAMPREDYERFKHVASKELPDNLKIYSELSGDNYSCKFMKVHDISTTFVEEGYRDKYDRYTGIWVDIMPLDGIPKGTFHKKVYFLSLNMLAKLSWHRKFQHDSVLGQKPTDIKKIIWEMIYLFIKWFPRKFFDEKFIEIQRRYAYDTTLELSYTWSCRAKEIIVPKSDFEDYVLFPFENYQMRCPVGYHNFLTVMFGDYMKLPPEEERVSCHKADILDLEKPYSYYLEKERKK